PRRGLRVARVAGLTVMSVYGPNGQEVGSDKYAYKLDWYRRFRAFLEASAKPDQAVVLCGDLNIAPEDRDVWDPEKWRGQIMFSDPERAAFRDLVAWGLRDSLRLHRQEGGLFTWWDYRAGAFHRGWGLRLLRPRRRGARRLAEPGPDPGGLRRGPPAHAAARLRRGRALLDGAVARRRRGLRGRRPRHGATAPRRRAHPRLELPPRGDGSAPPGRDPRSPHVRRRRAPDAGRPRVPCARSPPRVGRGG